MKTILTVLILLLAGSGWLAAAELQMRFQVTHFPQEAYLNERVTFILSGQPGSSAEVFLNERKLSSGIFQTDRLEFNLSFKASGILRFTQGREAYAFHLVLPETKAKLRQQDGFLYSGKGPVILLTRHLHPPKHDRTWETVKIVRSLVGDTRPAVKSAALVGGAFLPRGDLAALGEFSGVGSKFWRHCPAGPGLFELNSLIAGRDQLQPADALILALSTRDLERGVTSLGYRLRLEWYLQSLRRHKFKHVFVLSLPFDRRSQARFPEITGHLRLAAASNRAVFIEGLFHTMPHPLKLKAWLKPVLRNLRKEVKLE